MKKKQRTDKNTVVPGFPFSEASLSLTSPVSLLKVVSEYKKIYNIDRHVDEKFFKTTTSCVRKALDHNMLCSRDHNMTHSLNLLNSRTVVGVIKPRFPTTIKTGTYDGVAVLQNLLKSL